MNHEGDPFIDEAVVTVRAGDGGNGCVAFRREKFVPRGGPAGGDGGNGGSVVFVADANLSTLLDHKFRRVIEAKRGGDGAGSNMAGANAADEIVRVPLGTVISAADAAPGEPALADLSEAGQRYEAARGGIGGFGNARYATATRQMPDFAKPGTHGESRKLRLALKLIADVGLLGLPNAGKSTLLSRISAARPRIADYPFTTLTPNLGVVKLDDQRFVVADIPGLIEGASEGAGLGDRFLRHVERTRVLLHLLDCTALLDDSRDLLGEYETIRKELAAYDSALTERRELVLLTKIDALGDRALLEPIQRALEARGCTVLRASGVSGEGIPELVRALWRVLQEERA
ncbi:MAG TPA: GTPase ObgE [Myxococcota bacterium]|jgi:GTP-binding protein